MSEFPEGVTGQIKIDLSVEHFDGTSFNRKGVRIRRRMKSSTIRKIFSTLSRTGAENIQVRGDGCFTVISYAARPSL